MTGPLESFVDTLTSPFTALWGDDNKTEENDAKAAPECTEESCELPAATPDSEFKPAGTFNVVTAYDKKTLSGSQRDAIDYIDQASDHLSKGNYDDARNALKLAEFNNVSSFNSFMSNSMSHLFRGEKPVDNEGLIANDIQFWSGLIDNCEGNAAVEEGKALYDEGDYYNAAANYSKAIKLDTRNVEARKLRLKANEQQLRWSLGMGESEGPIKADMYALDSEQIEMVFQMNEDQNVIHALTSPETKPAITKEEFTGKDPDTGREIRRTIYFRDSLQVGKVTHYQDTGETISEGMSANNEFVISRSNKAGDITALNRFTRDGHTLIALGPDKAKCRNWAIYKEDKLIGASLDFSKAKDRQAIAKDVAKTLIPEASSDKFAQRRSQVADYLEKRADLNPKMQVKFTDDGSIMTSRKTNKNKWTVVDVAKFQSGTRMPSEGSGGNGPGETLAVYTYLLNKKGKMLTEGAAANLPSGEYYGNGRMVEWHRVGVLREGSAGMRIEVQEHNRDADGSWTGGERQKLASWTDYKQPSVMSLIGDAVMHDVPVVSQLLQVGNSAVKGMVGASYILATGVADVAGASPETTSSLFARGTATWAEVGVSMPWDDHKADADQRRREFYSITRDKMSAPERAAFDENIEREAFQQGWRAREFEGKAGSAHKVYRQLFGDKHKSFQSSAAAFGSYGFSQAPGYFMREAAMTDSTAAKIGLTTLGLTTAASDAFLGGAALGILGEGVGLIKGVGQFLKVGAHAYTATPFLIGAGAGLINDVPLIVKGFTDSSPEAQRQAFEAANRIVQSLVLFALTGRGLAKAMKPTPGKSMQLAEKSAPSKANLDTHYKALGLEPGAPLSAVKKAFRKLASKHHPDKASTPEAKAAAQKKFNEVNDAHQALDKALNPSSSANKLYTSDPAPQKQAKAESNSAAEASPVGETTTTWKRPAAQANAQGNTALAIPAEVQSFMKIYKAKISQVNPDGSMVLQAENATYVYVPGVGIGQSYARPAAEVTQNVAVNPGQVPATPFERPISPNVTQDVPVNAGQNPAMPFERPGANVAANGTQIIPQPNPNVAANGTQIIPNPKAQPQPTNEVSGVTRIGKNPQPAKDPMAATRVEGNPRPVQDNSVTTQVRPTPKTHEFAPEHQPSESAGNPLDSHESNRADPVEKMLYMQAEIAKQVRETGKWAEISIQIETNAKLEATKINIEISPNADSLQVTRLNQLLGVNARQAAQQGQTVYIDVPVSAANRTTSGGTRRLAVALKPGVTHSALQVSGYNQAWTTASHWQSPNGRIRIPVANNKIGKYITVYEVHAKLGASQGNFKTLAESVRDKVGSTDSKLKLINMVRTVEAMRAKIPEGRTNAERFANNDRRSAIDDAVSHVTNRFANAESISEADIAYAWSMLGIAFRSGVAGSGRTVVRPVDSVKVEVPADKAPAAKQDKAVND